MYICIYIYIKVMTDGVEEIPIELRDEREVKYIQGAAPCSPVYLTELLFFYAHQVKYMPSCTPDAAAPRFARGGGGGGGGGGGARASEPDST